MALRSARRRGSSKRSGSLAAALARKIPQALRVEENIEETFTFYRLPREHHKHLKSTNMLERLNQELKRRTHVIRIFPNQESCLRLIRALAVEIHEDWIEGPRYLNMEMLREQRKQLQPTGGRLKSMRRLVHKPVALTWRERQSSLPSGLRLLQPRPAGRL